MIVCTMTTEGCRYESIASQLHAMAVTVCPIFHAGELAVETDEQISQVYRTIFQMVRHFSDGSYCSGHDASLLRRVG